jgi:hypothetical protein
MMSARAPALNTRKGLCLQIPRGVQQLDALLARLIGLLGQDGLGVDGFLNE